MTVIRVHELAKKMGVESKDLILVLEKMGITAKTPSSGLDDKESKSLIEKLKAIRKDKEKDKIKKETPDPLASGEERRKKAAALIGKFSSTLEKPGAKPKPAPVIPPLPKPEMPAPPVILPPGQVKPAPVVDGRSTRACGCYSCAALRNNTSTAGRSRCSRCSFGCPFCTAATEHALPGGVRRPFPGPARDSLGPPWAAVRDLHGPL